MSDAPSPGDPVDVPPARYETADRAQLTLIPMDLEALLPPDHMARLVWRFVEGLDLRAFYAAIQAREGTPGRPPIDPKILVALWLYATIDGIGSAREVDRLCETQDGYRWLRGGVSVNYHTLSDFRGAHQTALEGLLTQSIATLRHCGVVTLARVAQDGTRIRASAGAGSFHREGTLKTCLAEAEQLVARTHRQADAPVSRQAAAQTRAAAARLARVTEALATLPAVAAAKQRNRARGEARASTTDPDARVMKMADGGFRPAYNVQVALDTDSQVILGVTATTSGSDQHQFTPMLTQLADRGLTPATYLLDGGYASAANVDAAAGQALELLTPVPRQRGTPTPVPPQPTDSPAVQAWRARMQTEAARAAYRRRPLVERVFGDWKTHRAWTSVPVRGVTKVQTWVLWFALAHNLRRTVALTPPGVA